MAKKSFVKGAILTGMVLSLLILPLGSVFAGKAEMVNVAQIAPLSGGIAFVGVVALNSMKLAAEEINNAGGFKVGGKNYKFNIIGYDSEANPAKAVAGMKKLKSQHDLKFAFTLISGSTLAMLEQNEKMDVFIITAGQDPRITKKGNKLVVRLNSPASVAASLQAKSALKALGPIKFATLCDTGDWGRAYQGIFSKIFKEGGAKLVAEEWIDERTDTDFYPQLTKIKGKKVNAFFMAAHDDAGALIIKQTRELGMKIPIIIVHGFSSKGIKMAGSKNLEGCLFAPAAWDLQDGYPGIGKYKESYKKKFKKDTAIFGTGGYDGIYILKAAMEKAGTVSDTKKIRQAFLKTVLPKDICTICSTGYSSDGDAFQPVSTGRFINGKLVVE